MELGLALLRPLRKVVLWTGGEPDMLPEFYGSVYEPRSH
jgi:hypothetical protein